jgi:hypothetical protein
MPLNATREELDIIRIALREYRDGLRDRARVFCTGYSEAGMDLCVQRLNVENVIHKLDEFPFSSCQAPIPAPVPKRPNEMPSITEIRRAA